MLSSLFGQNSGGVGAGLLSGALGSLLAGMNQAPKGQQLPNTGNAANSLYSDIGGMNNPFSGLQPVAFDQLLAMMNNPTLNQYMQGAQGAGGAAAQAGNQAQQGSNLLMGNANALTQSGFDPQGDLYRKLQQQNTDQSNVINSMYGVQSSPYGAGVANQSNQNFNIDWQNQQLQRQLAASQGAGQAATGAQGLGNSAIQDYLASGSIPYGAYTTGVGGVNNALNTYLGQANQGNQSQQQALQDWMQYLGLGNATAGVNQNAFGMNQNTAGMYGSSLFPAVSNLFGGSNTSGGFPDAQPYSGPYATQLTPTNLTSNLTPVTGPGGSYNTSGGTP